MPSRATIRGEGQSRFTAATLLAAVVLLLTQAFFADATVTAASVHACCRAHGRHFSSMHAECGGETDHSTFSSVREKCPFGPMAASNFTRASFVPGSTIDVVALTPASFASSLPQICYSQADQDQSNLKRGPPSMIVLL